MESFGSTVDLHEGNHHNHAADDQKGQGHTLEGQSGWQACIVWVPDISGFTVGAEVVVNNAVRASFFAFPWASIFLFNIVVGAAISRHSINTLNEVIIFGEGSCGISTSGSTIVTLDALIFTTDGELIVSIITVGKSRANKAESQQSTK